jgi:succinoglycan biosynthesis protein ExoV
MRIVYYRDPVGNFGDDLNELIWPRLIPEIATAPDDLVLVGIGSLLDSDRFRDVETAGKRVFVLGSGAAYGRLPDGYRDWTYLAVRGPLTGRLVERPEAVATDSAALLATLPDLVPSAPRRDAILFMPHHRTLTNSHWRKAAERAGLEFVDPRWRPDRILEAYGRAKLVVTEAMHGAIVADTLRIPWIPVIISPEVSVFKWRDWLGSVGLPYRPVNLPPTARLEAYRYDRITRLTARDGQVTSGSLDSDSDDELLIADFNRRYAGEVKLIDGVPASPGLKTAVKRVITLFDGPATDRAAKALRHVAQGPQWLSPDATFGDKVEQLQAGVASFRQAIVA